MEFTYCKLIDVLSDIHSGGTPSTEESSYWGGNIKWLSSGETSQRFISDTVDKITEEGVKNSSAKLAKKNNIVMACAGQGKTRGQTSYLLDDMYINQSVIALETNASVLPLYLFYFLSSRYEALRGGTVAISTRGSITTTALKNLPFKYPDLSTQQSIVDILFGYDSLIETNNRRIELLEQTAQELYKEWFVRFRFPGYEAAKFENGLPQGWSYEKFKDELTYNTGKLDSNATVLDGEYSFYTCAKTIYKTNTYCFDGECVLLGGNNATGDFSLFYANEKLDAYQRTYIVTPQNQTLSCAYIYFVLKDYLLQFKTASIGATTKFLTKGMLDKAKILVPDEKTILRYNEIAKNMFDQIVSLKAKNENLVSQRNMLLPRLMSGKLEV